MADMRVDGCFPYTNNNGLTGEHLPPTSPWNQCLESIQFAMSVTKIPDAAAGQRDMDKTGGRAGGMRPGRQQDE